MTNMINSISTIISDVLTAVYQPFWFSVVLAVFVMYAWHNAQKDGWKTVVKQWGQCFKTDQAFRRRFFLAFYTILILFRTLLNREIWANPLSNVIGVWSLTDGTGNLSSEPVENLMLFIPFSILFFWTKQTGRQEGRYGIGTILWQSFRITFLFSLAIESAQLLLRLGTFQLSDLFYNTVGGVIGGALYWGWRKIQEWKTGRNR